MKQKFTLAFSLFLFLLILFHPLASLEGAKSGLLLLYQSLLPSLLPYTILSSMILGLGFGNMLTRHLSPVSRRITGLSGQGCFAFITGMFCGYPLGAKITAQFVRAGQISLSEGQYLISFANMASPVFLIQYVSVQCLGNMTYLRPMLFSVYGAAFLTALTWRPLLHAKAHSSRVKTRKTSANDFHLSEAQHSFKQTDAVSIVQDTHFTYSFNDAIMEGFETMVRLGGYLMFFSIIVKMVTGYLTAVTTSNYFLIGVLEITNGIHIIAGSSLPQITKLLLLSFCVSFGGISCIAQTAGMCQNSGLSMPLYLAAKLQNGVLAVLLMYLWYTGVY